MKEVECIREVKRLKTDDSDPFNPKMIFVTMGFEVGKRYKQTQLTDHEKQQQHPIRKIIKDGKEIAFNEIHFPFHFVEVEV